MHNPAAESAPLLQIKQVSKIYDTINKGPITAVKEADIDIGRNQFVSIVGSSGCGKSTLLNMIAGLIKPSTGEIVLDGKKLTGPTPEVGLIFQRPVLFPWRRVIDNVMLPVEVLGLKPHHKYLQKAKDLLDMVGLSNFIDAYPKELSGGMQQRVSIARALVYDTKILMLDEPFAALDAMTRDELNIELLRIWKETGSTFVFVTHNIPEAVLLSSKIVVMTARPGTVKKVIDVPIPYPRSLGLVGDPTFGNIVTEVRELLGHH